MDRWQAMRVFVKVAETASFAEAARQLRMSPPAVTRSIAALEDAIGARLFVRTTRSVKLTEAGVRYGEDCRRILADIAEAEAAAGGAFATPSGDLTVTASLLFGQVYVLPILLRFLDLFPAVRARALFVDRQVNLVEEGVDVAIRIGQLPDSGLRAIKVGSVRRVVCGAPAYFDRHGMPKTPGDLRDHRIVASTGAWASPEWRFASHQRVLVRPVLETNGNEAAIQAAIAGFGVTRVLHYQIGPALQDGKLQIVLSDHEDPPLPIHVVYPEGRHAPAKVRAFIEMAVESLRADRLLNGTAAPSIGASNERTDQAASRRKQSIA